MADMEKLMAEAQHQLALCNDYIAAKQELGCNISEAKKLRDDALLEIEQDKPYGAIKFCALARKLLREAQPEPDYPFVEPSSWEEFLRNSPVTVKNSPRAMISPTTKTSLRRMAW